jgi:N-acetylglutamate synthase-like GNAT family acetyltransferase
MLTLISGGEPWGQPRGSECDSLDDSAFRLFLLNSARKPLACGRLHFNAPDEAQVRFMAVHEDARGRGYGSRILEGLEARRHVAALRSSC